jgi:hypothetical protein
VSGTGTVVTASRTGRIGNDRAGGGPDQSTCNRGTGRSTCESSDQRARAAADQRTAEYAVFARRLAPGERQRHHGKQYNTAHPIPPSRFSTAKISGDVRQICGGMSFTVHELGTFSEVSKSSFRTYIRLLPLTAE